MSEQSVFRIHRTSNFTVIPNTLINDANLRAEDVGFLVRLLSLPTDWQFSISGLLALEAKRPKKARAGRDKLQGMMNRVIECGYVIKIQNRKGGRFSGVDYIVTDDPQKFKELYESSPETGFPVPVKNHANPPQPDLPETEKPATANPQQQNKKRNKEQTPQNRGDDYEKVFLEKWQEYSEVANSLKSKSGSKTRAHNLWKQLSAEDRNSACKKLSKHFKKAQEEGAKICAFSTYLREELWRDYQEEVSQKSVLPPLTEIDGVSRFSLSFFEGYLKEFNVGGHWNLEMCGPRPGATGSVFTKELAEALNLEWSE